jgi:two-component system response regulator FixJ
MDASEFLLRLSREAIAFPTIIIASGGDVAHAVEVMKAGATDVLERPYGDEVLLGAVRSALEIGAQAATQAAQRTVLATLTPREHDVLSAMLDGKSNKMIARHLGISSRTVEIHRARVMEKARVGSLAELVRLAIGAEPSH